MGVIHLMHIWKDQKEPAWSSQMGREINKKIILVKKCKLPERRNFF